MGGTGLAGCLLIAVLFGSGEGVGIALEVDWPDPRHSTPAALVRPGESSRDRDWDFAVGGASDYYSRSTFLTEPKEECLYVAIAGVYDYGAEQCADGIDGFGVGAEDGVFAGGAEGRDDIC